jgi:hypothetical protein
VWAKLERMKRGQPESKAEQLAAMAEAVMEERSARGE